MQVIGYRIVVVLLFLGLGTTAHAEPGANEAETEARTEKNAAEPARVREADRCPRLFGDDSIHTDNRARRKQALMWAEQEETGLIDVTHTTSWKRPRRVIFPGVEMLETDEDEAIIKLGPEHADLCPPGRYRVEVDDALGNGNRVLAVVGDVMLLESGSRLMWLGEPEHQVQKWRMVWASWWSQPAPRMANPVSEISGGGKTTSRSRNQRAAKLRAKRARAARAKAARARARARARRR